MKQHTWSDQVAIRVAAAVKAQRGKRSTQWLADETAALGHPVTRASISNLEVGRRKTVDLAELLVLTAALDVPPALLVFPLGQGSEDIEALPPTPNETPDEPPTPNLCSSWAASQWFTGRAGHGGWVVAMFEKHDQVCTQIDAAHLRKQTAEQWELEDLADPEEAARHQRTAAHAQADGEDAQQAVLYHRERMRKAGLVPPPLPTNIAFLATHEGQS